MAGRIAWESEAQLFPIRHERYGCHEATRAWARRRGCVGRTSCRHSSLHSVTAHAGPLHTANQTEWKNHWPSDAKPHQTPSHICTGQLVPAPTAWPVLKPMNYRMCAHSRANGTMTSTLTWEMYLHRRASVYRIYYFETSAALPFTFSGARSDTPDVVISRAAPK